MSKERIRDFVDWDEYYNPNNKVVMKKEKVYHSKISLMDRLEKCEDKQSLLDNEIHAIRDEVLELEARRLNAINKQSQR
mgnify:CR=1 FL=1|tara:strand:- start:87 stop:323 length:237 start_codon:yes stop_codon:yes gene_type:complete